VSRAVILLSGGLDSTTVAYLARSQGHDLWALSFDYGQRHRAELDASEDIATRLGIPRHVMTLDLAAFGGSALTADIPVPTEPSEGIPVTYVPARNTIMLSIALAYAETLEADAIYCGVNAVDYSGYPDCRPEFIDAFEDLANLATKRGVAGHYLTVHAPLLHMSKAEIVDVGLSLGVPFGRTVSCYQGSPACGVCDACRLRAAAFAANDQLDPAR
jgi:7-cyano-7-deazaguanine synthase